MALGAGLATVSLKTICLPPPGLGGAVGSIQAAACWFRDEEANASESSMGDASGVNTRPDSPLR